jgi:DNA-binding Lrp family transcriptional regulator
VDLRDFAVYRFLSPGGEARFWAGRRVIDPTVPAREIAKQVGLSESGVRSRLRGLARHGYLHGTSVIVNPSLFGVRVFVAELPLKDVRQVEQLFRDLALVDGVLFARDTLDEGDRQLRVHFVAEDTATAARRATLLRRLSPTGQLRGPQPYWIPSCERGLTPLDWRLLHALWANPDSTITRTASALGISLKTAARRYHELIESRACWWTHGPDSEEFPLALLWIEVRDPAHRGPLRERIAREASAWMPVAADGLGFEPGSPPAWIAGLVPADAPTVLEKLVKKCVAFPGVVNVRRTFPLGSATYPSWLAGRMVSSRRSAA